MKDMRVTKECERCGTEYKCSPSHAIRRKNCSLHCSNHGRQKNTGRTHFKKGNIPWHKDTFLVEQPKGRRQVYYRRLILEVSDSPCCLKCGESEKKLCVHHIDGDFHNNDLENLEIVCYSCHSKIHNTYLNFPNQVKGGNNNE